MILTITMNPSIDISYPLKKLLIDGVNRSTNTKKTAGGKGLNVTRVASLSGQPVIATGILGGTTGLSIKQKLDNDSIQHNFYTIEAESRNCIAILHENYQTEILESGPTISSEDQLAFKKHFESLLQSVNVVTMSGSLPSGISDTYYAELIEIANHHNKQVLLDSSGDSLKEAISNSSIPYLIKPNHEEVEQLLGKKMHTSNHQELIDAIKGEPTLMKIPVIVISLGKDGALAKHNKQFYKVSIPTIKAVNAVGAGDSALAGLAIGTLKKESIENTLKRSMTLGMLNTMETQTGYVNMSNYGTLYKQVTVTELPCT